MKFTAKKRKKLKKIILHAENGGVRRSGYTYRGGYTYRAGCRNIQYLKVLYSEINMEIDMDMDPDMDIYKAKTWTQISNIAMPDVCVHTQTSDMDMEMEIWH